jgi:hypothetical protein
MNFSFTRDALYVCTCVMGVGAGLMLKILKHKSPAPGRPLSETPPAEGGASKAGARERMAVTTGIFLCAVAIFSFGVLTIVTGGSFFYDKGLVRAAALIFLISTFVSLFPIAGGFPVFVIVSVYYIYIVGCFFSLNKNEYDGYVKTEYNTRPVCVKAGDLIPIVGGELRYGSTPQKENFIFRREEFYISPANNRLSFSFLDARKPPTVPSLAKVGG